MKSDKEIKVEYKKKASAEPEKNYPVAKIKEHGFSRKKCSSCGKNFWALDTNRKVCGDSNCSGGYSFIGNPPSKKGFDYLETWKAFRDYFKKLGYYEYKRYPVVARWRPDVYWVGASVYPFQPYVVKGEIKPKSNAVIIPQLSLRFNDIDNVGITGSHYVCFDMLGQLHFEKKENYNQSQYWDEYFNWIVKGMGIPKEELIVHEDAWAGGGTFGPCMEFFARGMEIGNQVYMQYEQTDSSYKELDIKVLDMGQGHERVPWLTTGKSNSYETTFPTVAKKLYKITGYKPDEKLMQKFLPYSALLNVDETDDIEKVWSTIAKKLSIDVKELKEKILPLAAIYSIGEHSRAALVALNDNALPSNVGGGYNLRIILRRALGFIDDYNWDISLPDLAEEHAKFLKPMYPELSEKLDNVSVILENEKKKFLENKQRSKQIIVNQLAKSKSISLETLTELYDSHGVRPEQVKKEAASRGIELEVPDDFYSLVAERHEKTEHAVATKKEFKIDLSKVPETKILYFDDWSKIEFDAKVVYSKDNLVALDETRFYPTSGGQIHDIGEINGLKVVDVFKQDSVVLHKLETNTLKVGDKVKGKIDFARRKQLMQHHSSAHLVNLCAYEVLGPHVWQAGAAKTLEKGRLDITHYDQISEKELKQIEDCCNEKIKKNLKVKSEILSREDAEDKYGMHIYQGGFVPGKKLRIVTIGTDSEACGGTHANSLADLEELKIIGSTKVQDGIIRINYTAGKAAKQEKGNVDDLMKEVSEILGVSPSQVPKRAEELFEKWKSAKKAVKKGEKIDLKLISKETSKGTTQELLNSAAKAFSTQTEHLPKTLKRFLSDLEEFTKK
ncbi:MAG TPA: alanine--tRNA ligase [archaeon]|nr:alanine--tRNA ligase [archaeon]